MEKLIYVCVIGVHINSSEKKEIRVTKYHNSRGYVLLSFNCKWRAKTSHIALFERQ